MQLTGGQYKGRRIVTPQGVRPTLSNVRESVFNVLNSYFGADNNFEDKFFLDMFLGSGIMTFEAISRGFEVTSFEINPSVIKIALANAKTLGVNGLFFRGDCLKNALKLDDKFDVIYADPPWDFSYLEIFEACKKLLSEDGLAVIECDKKKKPDILKELNSMSTPVLFREKNYGRCCLLFVKLKG